MQRFSIRPDETVYHSESRRKNTDLANELTGSSGQWSPNKRNPIELEAESVSSDSSASYASYSSDGSDGEDSLVIDQPFAVGKGFAKRNERGVEWNSIAPDELTGEERDPVDSKKQHNLSRFFGKQTGNFIKKLVRRKGKHFKTKTKDKLPFFVPVDFEYQEEEHLFSAGLESTKYRYKLTFFQRVFVTMEHGTASGLGWFVSISITLVTMLSVMIYIIGSLPEVISDVSSCSNPTCDNDSVLCPGIVICEPEPPASFSVIEKVCLYIFVIDYFLRIFLCTVVPKRLTGIKEEEEHLNVNDDNTAGQIEELGSRHSEDEDSYKFKLRVLYQYVTLPMNLVDFVAILPFFLDVAGQSTGNTLSIVRVLRLARILRVLKLGKGSKGVQVLLATMVASSPALIILGFFSLIGVILLGALEFFFEGGDFRVTADHLNGAYLTPDVSGTSMMESFFTSIPMAMYWSIITSTAVGFGDLVPTTYMGRLIAVIAMYGGILVLALPISVIGNNFERIYDQSKGHLSYGVVNAILELMEDDTGHNPEDLEKNWVKENETHTHDEYYYARLNLIERRASKLASVFVIAHVCLDETEAEDLNILLAKIGLRDMIAALEFVYDVEFRHRQLRDFARVSKYHGVGNTEISTLSIGSYNHSFGGHSDEIDFDSIEAEEQLFYEGEFNKLNDRTKEVVRYLRKSPEYLDLQKGYMECALNGSSVKSPANFDDLNKPQHKFDTHKQKANEIKARITLAYKRIEMAMAKLESGKESQFKSMKIGKTSTVNLRPFATHESSESLISEVKLEKNTTRAVDYTPLPITGTPGALSPIPTGNTPLPNNAGSPS